MRSKQTIPTLEDVAKAAGVSTATVSRCLNTPKLVVETTRARVMEAVEQLGYIPNFGARAMAAKRTYTIGAIVPTIENSIFAKGLQAFQEELFSLGYTLLMASSAYRAEAEEEQIRSLITRGADGLLLIGYERDPAIYTYLQRQEVPVLVTWTYAKTKAVPSVGFDNFQAMRGLAEAVIALGHRKIGIIAGVTRHNDRATERLQGIKAAAQDADATVEIVFDIEARYDVEAGGDAFEQLIKNAPETSVVMCGNDVLGVGALIRARAMGMRVPEDISITGFDDVQLARIVEPQLTTVQVPHREMGRKAAAELVAMVEKSSAGVSHELESRLMLRGSLGAPRLG